MWGNILVLPDAVGAGSTASSICWVVHGFVYPRGDLVSSALASMECGALSEPKKDFVLPDIEPRQKASQSALVLTTGLQEQKGSEV